MKFTNLPRSPWWLEVKARQDFVTLSPMSMTFIQMPLVLPK